MYRQIYNTWEVPKSLIFATNLGLALVSLGVAVVNNTFGVLRSKWAIG
jgi:hypothetical protein